MDLKNLKGAFAHDITELPNYNFKKNLFIYLVQSRSRFLTKIADPAPAPAKYGGSTAPVPAPAPQHWFK